MRGNIANDLWFVNLGRSEIAAASAAKERSLGRRGLLPNVKATRFPLCKGNNILDSNGAVATEHVVARLQPALVELRMNVTARLN